MLRANDNYYLNLIENKVYRVGIYARLSKEDLKKNNGQSSESIRNQIDYLQRIVNERGWNLIDIYSDDGISGTDFDRPDFQRMIRDIENNRINLVITKDLSRLGRDHIETGRYLEKYFPLMNVRYIAVNDNIDTFIDSSGNDMGPFKAVIDDFYARDISKKVRSAISTKRQSGKFIGSFAPYGYTKDIIHKNKLVIDPDTAVVVKRIYSLYVGGNSLRNIAYILNTEGIESPAKYKSAKSAYRGGKTKYYAWGPETIKLILSNPTYKGSLSQNKFTKVNYKLKAYRNIPKDSWIVVDGTHQPIIDGNTFDLVQDMLEKKACSYNTESNGMHLLSGIIYCGDCGSRMTFLTGSNKNIYAVCSKYKRFRQCTRHSFSEKELNRIILEELQKSARQHINIEKFSSMAEKASKRIATESSRNKLKEADRIDARLKEIKSVIKSLYEDKVKGIISETDFKEMSETYNSEREQCINKLENTRKRIQDNEKSLISGEDLSKLIKQFIDFESVDKATLTRLIKRIEIFEELKLKITYNFKSPY